MRMPEPVIWAKGTVLTPQHLQVQDRYFEESLNFQFRALNFMPWGFSSLQVDQQALASGDFLITQASGILPDGLPFDIPRSDPAPPPRKLEFEQDQDSLEVHLTVPHFREGGANVARRSRDMDSRYRAEVEMIRDENTGKSEKPVLVARKNFRLLLEGENLEGSACLRAAIVRREAGLLRIEQSYIPPLLDVGASDYLVSIARRLVEILTARSASLAAMRRQKKQSLAEFDSSDIANFWLLYTINTAQPVFRHILESRAGHPELLYSSMVSLAGSLSTFSADPNLLRELPLYDHDRLGACFTILDEKIQLLLETVVPRNFISLPLKLDRPSVYVTALDRDDYLKGARLYLAMSPQPPDLTARTPVLAKICSADYIDVLVQKGVGGVPLAHAQPPRSIPLKLNYQYYSLTQSGGAWEAITRARNLAVYLPGDYSDPEMELIILLPEKG